MRKMRFKSALSIIELKFICICTAQHSKQFNRFQNPNLALTGWSALKIDFELFVRQSLICIWSAITNNGMKSIWNIIIITLWDELKVKLEHKKMIRQRFSNTPDWVNNKVWRDSTRFYDSMLMEETPRFIESSNMVKGDAEHHIYTFSCQQTHHRVDSLMMNWSKWISSSKKGIFNVKMSTSHNHPTVIQIWVLFSCKHSMSFNVKFNWMCVPCWSVELASGSLQCLPSIFTSLSDEKWEHRNIAHC